MSMRSYQSSRGRGGGRGGRGGSAPVQQEPPVQYAFPHMDVGEILEDMALFGHPVNEATLKAPTAEDVHSIFSFFLREIFGDELDSKLSPAPECYEVMSYPDIHEESPAIYHFVRAVYEMLCFAQYGDFNIHDLISPVRSRFRWQISALLNIAKFRQSRLGIYETLASGEDDCVAQHAELQRKIDNIGADIAAIEAARAEEQPEVEENNRVIPELSNHLTQLRKQQLDLTKSTSEQKAVFTALSDKVSDLKLQVLSVKNEVAEKKAKVVASPDRAMSEIAAMEERLRKMREGTQELVRKKAEKQARCNAIRAATESLKMALKATEECAARNERKQELDSQVRKSMAKKAEIEEGMRRDDESLSLLQKSMESMQGRRARQEQQREELQQQIAQDVQRTNQKALEAQRHSEEVERKVEAYKKREHELMSQTILVSKQFADEMTKMSAKQEAMLEHSENHNQQLREVMAMFAADNKKSIEDLKQKRLSTDGT